MVDGERQAKRDKPEEEEEEMEIDDDDEAEETQQNGKSACTSNYLPVSIIIRFTSLLPFFRGKPPQEQYQYQYRHRQHGYYVQIYRKK